MHDGRATMVSTPSRHKLRSAASAMESFDGVTGVDGAHEPPIGHAPKPITGTDGPSRPSWR
jgi:hypothetical protein